MILATLFAREQAKDALMAMSVIDTIAPLFPSLLLMMRRLPNTGKPWLWIVIALVPRIGGLWLIALLAQPSLPA